MFRSGWTSVKQLHSCPCSRPVFIRTHHPNGRPAATGRRCGQQPFHASNTPTARWGSHMPPRPRFPVDTQPWVPVRTGRHQEMLGLRELFCRAHRIDDLALPLPPATAGLLRALVAITARLTGLDDPDLGIDEWSERRTALLRDHNRLDPDRVEEYFDRGHWDAFDSERPWLQDPALAHQCAISSGVNALIMGRPAGGNLCWFEPDTDTDPAPVPTQQALWHLLIQHSYGNPGRQTPRILSGTTGDATSGQGTAGPLRGTLSFHPLGRTLLETLLLGLPPLTEDDNPVPDLCPWEEAAPPDPQAPPPPVTWPGRLLTGRSRHAVLLVPNDDGTAVTDAYLTWSTQAPRLDATDPYLIYQTNPKAPVEYRRTPRRAEAGRAVWRDLDALLLAGDENPSTQRPSVYTALNDLPPGVRDALRVRVIGFDQDVGLVKNRLWYTALTPPIWIWAQEHNPAIARRIAECRTTAEHLAGRLGAVAARAFREITSPKAAGTGAGGRPRRPGERDPSWAARARTAYWPLAETTFWRLVSDTPDAPAHRAFADDAVTALRKVATASLSQHTRAAEILAASIAELRRDPDTPRPRRKAPALP
jgi:CRISPR system Cascade subunit CasA